ncbi:MAG: hypothetical protein MjAS7_0500 [Metallosphaera javensis (ex Sakai et al. 2022)]|nr:MAG: hypothetical protein MjAS7_0500 [Metallosphaera javensis (ex Sakai et al. 2022)]
MGTGPIKITPPTVVLEGCTEVNVLAKSSRKPAKIRIIPARVNLIISDSMISLILVT